jgi:hypothetical protein
MSRVLGIILPRVTAERRASDARILPEVDREEAVPSFSVDGGFYRGIEAAGN